MPCREVRSCLNRVGQPYCNAPLPRRKYSFTPAYGLEWPRQAIVLVHSGLRVGMAQVSHGACLLASPCRTPTRAKIISNLHVHVVIPSAETRPIKFRPVGLASSAGGKPIKLLNFFPSSPQRQWTRTSGNTSSPMEKK